MSALFLQDPDEVLDYTIDYQDGPKPVLGTDETIVTSEWFVFSGDAEIGEDDHEPTNDDTTTTVWILGGTSGVATKLINRITTSELRTFERTITVRIKATT